MHWLRVVAGVVAWASPTPWHSFPLTRPLRTRWRVDQMIRALSGLYASCPHNPPCLRPPLPPGGVLTKRSRHCRAWRRRHPAWPTLLMCWQATRPVRGCCGWMGVVVMSGWVGGKQRDWWVWVAVVGVGVCCRRVSRIGLPTREGWGAKDCATLRAALRHLVPAPQELQAGGPLPTHPALSRLATLPWLPVLPLWARWPQWVCPTHVHSSLPASLSSPCPAACTLAAAIAGALAAVGVSDSTSVTQLLGGASTVLGKTPAALQGAVDFLTKNVNDVSAG